MRKLAIDCEMVGGSGNEQILAKVALVDENLYCVYDKFVAPTGTVTDYRTSISGITANDLRGAPSFSQVQREVANLISGCLLIGHSVADVDLEVLNLNHPEHNIRDVAKYPPFKQYNYGNKPSLKMLAEKVLGERIQDGPHDPVQDAKTAMKLYKKVAHQWQ
ncbi:hypothetical protein ABMA27_017006 [Loxostege sticticalis]|uniref:RNA exonuclease 4 n=1 Tax=Loxostege sticticalis TaxID=481309 RepID=A0ABR3GYF2_LOXSC